MPSFYSNKLFSASSPLLSKSAFSNFDLFGSPRAAPPTKAAAPTKPKSKSARAATTQPPTPSPRGSSIAAFANRGPVVPPRQAGSSLLPFFDLPSSGTPSLTSGDRTDSDFSAIQEASDEDSSDEESFGGDEIDLDSIDDDGMFIHSNDTRAMTPRPAASPVVLASPESASRFQAERKSVHVDQEMINWARPFQPQEQAAPAPFPTHIFGQSSQRARRMGRRIPVPKYTAPSSDSSDNEQHQQPQQPYARPSGPSTPTTPSSASFSTASSALPSTPESAVFNHWSAISPLQGLGVRGVPMLAGLQSQVCPEPETPVGLLFGQDFPAMKSVPYGLAVPMSVDSVYSPECPDEAARATAALAVPSRAMLITSDSLHSFASPTTLAELRSLRQAAVDMEAELKKTAPVNAVASSSSTSPIASSSSSVSTPATPATRRIRRKAVPSVPVSPANEAHLASTPNFASGSTVDLNSPLLMANRMVATLPSTPAAQSGRYTMDVDMPAHAAAEEAFDPALIRTRLERPGSSAGQRRAKAGRTGFYANAKATMSVIEMSPRAMGLPFRFGSRRSGASNSAATEVAVPDLSSNGSSCSDSSAPSTPPRTMTLYRLDSNSEGESDSARSRSSHSGSSDGVPTLAMASSRASSSGSSISERSPQTPTHLPAGLFAGAAAQSTGVKGVKHSANTSIYGSKKEMFISMLDLGLSKVKVDGEKRFSPALRSSKKTVETPSSPSSTSSFSTSPEIAQMPTLQAIKAADSAAVRTRSPTPTPFARPATPFSFRGGSSNGGESGKVKTGINKLFSRLKA